MEFCGWGQGIGVHQLIGTKLLWLADILSPCLTLAHIVYANPMRVNGCYDLSRGYFCLSHMGRASIDLASRGIRASFMDLGQYIRLIHRLEELVEFLPRTSKESSRMKGCDRHRRRAFRHQFLENLVILVRAPEIFWRHFLCG